MTPVPRPVDRPMMACEYSKLGFMRVASSTNQACRWVMAASAYLACPVIFQAAVKAGTSTLSRRMA